MGERDRRQSRRTRYTEPIARVSLSLPESQVAAIKKHAINNNTTVSAVFQEAVSIFLQAERQRQTAEALELNRELDLQIVRGLQ